MSEFVALLPLLAAKISAKSRQMNATEADQHVASAVFNALERFGQISQPLGLAVAEYLTKEIRRLRSN